MKAERLTAAQVEPIVWGGAVLGGGGGGAIAHGVALGRAALEYGDPFLADVDDLSSGSVLTVSMVGTPSRARSAMKHRLLIRAVELMLHDASAAIVGFIPNEVGAVAVVNGWIQSAHYGLPVVDAPCNGRAHPFAEMGSMGLGSVSGFVSHQAAVGRSFDSLCDVELVVTAPLEIASRLVREASITAGGNVAVARNPVDISYVKEHAAPGALRQALHLGNEIVAVQSRGGRYMAEIAANVLHGEVIAVGVVESLDVEAKGGFDVGVVGWRDGDTVFEVTIANEYITLVRDGEVVAGFPDLIMAFDVLKAIPLPSAALRTGEQVAWISVPSAHLKLGAGATDPELLSRLQNMVGSSLLH